MYLGKTEHRWRGLRVGYHNQTGTFRNIKTKAFSYILNLLGVDYYQKKKSKKKNKINKKQNIYNFLT